MPNASTDETGFVFGSKAETLARLASRCRIAHFCPQIIVQLDRWHSEPDPVVAEILSHFSSQPLVIRSSAANEDGWIHSMAGAYLSVPNVHPQPDDIRSAIQQVAASYGTARRGDQILVQPMVREVVLAGVVLTRDLDTGSPYYAINYDDRTGRTDTVTGGGESKMVFVRHDRLSAIHSPRIRKLMDAITEIESLTNQPALDIEFCVTREERVLILQVRPLAAQRQWTTVSDTAINDAVDGIRQALGQRMQPTAAVCGTTTLLGEMPDWNPAEMIGNTPRPLALSLYRRLITDDVWWRARADMGYRAVPAPLLVDLAGRPYIDVRLSLNSFLPASISDPVGSRVVDCELDILAKHRDLHDKIEFDVAVTCRDFDFAGQSQRLRNHGLDASSTALLGEALRGLTARALEARRQRLDDLLARTRRLRMTGHIRDILEDCARNGTLPFAELARHAFIGMALLRSLVARGAISPLDSDLFLQSIQTVATSFVRDLAGVNGGSISQPAFLEAYGHLRPGTYDILSWRYDEAPDLYLGHASRPLAAPESFSVSHEGRTAVGTLLRESGYDLTPEELFAYIGQAVAAREEAKFNFTRSVSETLRRLTLWGETVGLGREDLSFLPISAIIDDADVGRIRSLIAEGREKFPVTRAIRLPHLIAELDDADVVRMPLGRPTFITSKAIVAPMSVVTKGATQPAPGRIALIESADPGFDWIFTHDIVGLVTKYGGANSHMAIRCAEFGLPAAIGCGDRRFSELASSHAIELNCTARIVRPAAGLR